MSLVADYSSSSNDEASSDDEMQLSNNGCQIPNKKSKLPSANLILSGGTTGKVFSNPYKEAEKAKIALLEKHVKMVNTEEHIKEKNGKKICWNYRKGRCRFGINCSFAHDSDLNQNPNNETPIENNDDKQLNENNIPLEPDIRKQHNQTTSLNTGNTSNSSICFLQESTQETKKRRPGLGNSIVPSKKVMKSYQIQGKRKFS